jgi:GntR family transcriptional regulator, transcriptional repressor for pyruvate dehydrogenase complex
MKTDFDRDGWAESEPGPLEAPSVVIVLASALRREILGKEEPNAFLGSEDDLASRFGVSKPTFRQAARLLEFEELVTVRRGPGGGYFARTPGTSVLLRAAATYLVAKRTPLADVVKANGVVVQAALAEIAANPDAKLRAQLLGFLDHESVFQSPSDPKDVLAGIKRFWLLVSSLAGNEALALFLQVSLQYIVRADAVESTPERLRAYVGELRRLAEHIAAGDLDAMNREYRTGYRQMALGWLEADASRRSPPTKAAP